MAEQKLVVDVTTGLVVQRDLTGVEQSRLETARAESVAHRAAEEALKAERAQREQDIAAMLEEWRATKRPAGPG